MQTMDNELFFAGVMMESGETMDATYTEKVKDDSTFKKVIDWLKHKSKQILEGVKKVIAGIANKVKNIRMIVKSLSLSSLDSAHIHLATRDDDYNNGVIYHYKKSIGEFSKVQSQVKDELMKLKSAHDEAVFKGCEERISQIEKRVEEIKKRYDDEKKAHLEVKQYAQAVTKIYEQIAKPISENARQLGRYMSEYVKSMIRALSTNSNDPEEVAKRKEELRMARFSIALQARILRLLINSAIWTSITRFFKFPSKKAKA